MENERKPAVTGYPAAAQSSYHVTGAGVPTYGTAYPYPAPPYYGAPPPDPPPYYDPAASNLAKGNAACLRRLVVAAIAVFLVISVVTFVLWLVVRPHVPEFAVSSASVSSFNVSSSRQLSANFNVSLSVRNPNKKAEISYYNVGAAVLYGSETISETWLPPFYQGAENSTVVQASFAAVAEYVDPFVANGIAKDRSSNGGAVVFNVRVAAWVRFWSGAWRGRRHSIRVFCDNIRIGFSNATASVGTLSGPPQPCEVRL